MQVGVSEGITGCSFTYISKKQVNVHFILFSTEPMYILEYMHIQYCIHCELYHSLLYLNAANLWYNFNLLNIFCNKYMKVHKLCNHCIGKIYRDMDFVLNCVNVAFQFSHSAGRTLNAKSNGKSPYVNL